VEGNCNRRRYLPRLLDLVRTGAIDPSTVLTQIEDLPSVLDVYASFDERQTGRPAVLDGAPEDADARDELLRDATVVRADSAEAALLAGGPLDDAPAVVAAAGSCCPEVLGSSRSGPARPGTWSSGRMVTRQSRASPAPPPTPPAAATRWSPRWRSACCAAPRRPRRRGRPARGRVDRAPPRRPA
jgi:hypothetical protein